MLQAYINADRDDWVEWLHLLKFTYNSATHSSTGTSPFLSLLGFQPWLTLDLLRKTSASPHNDVDDRSSDSYLAKITMHRDGARLVIA